MYSLLNKHYSICLHFSHSPTSRICLYDVPVLVPAIVLGSVLVSVIALVHVLVLVIVLGGVLVSVIDLVHVLVLVIVIGSINDYVIDV